MTLLTRRVSEGSSLQASHISYTLSPLSPGCSSEESEEKVELPFGLRRDTIFSGYRRIFRWRSQCRQPGVSFNMYLQNLIEVIVSCTLTSDEAQGCESSYRQLTLCEHHWGQMKDMRMYIMSSFKACIVYAGPWMSVSSAINIESRSEATLPMSVTFEGRWIKLRSHCGPMERLTDASRSSKCTYRAAS